MSIATSFTVNSRRIFFAGLVALLATSGVAPGEALAKPSKRYGIEGKFVSYDAASQTFTVYVTSRKASGFGGSTVGSKAPKDIEQRKERVFAVKPDGSVLSRTVIKSMKGTGLDNTGTREGFARAVSAIPLERTLAFSIEKNSEQSKDASAPEYRIKTVVIKMTDEELRAQFERNLTDDEEEE